jgi:hypothetical protein
MADDAVQQNPRVEQGLQARASAWLRERFVADSTRYARSAVALYLATFNVTVLAALSFFHCVSVPAAGGAERRVVSASPAVSCDGAAYRAWRGGVALVLVLELGVFPLALLGTLVAARREQLTRCVSEARAAWTVQVLSMLTAIHTERAFFWEFAVLGRRFALLLVAVFAFERVELAYLMLALLCMAFLCAHVLTAPFAAGEENRVEAASLVALCVLAMCAGKRRGARWRGGGDLDLHCSVCGVGVA